MQAKIHVPKGVKALRGLLARERISRKAVAVGYGASPQYIGAILNEISPVGHDALERLRSVVGAIIEERQAAGSQAR